MIHTLDVPPTKSETIKAIKQLQKGKAPGADGKPPEIFKAGGEALTEQLVSLFLLFWERSPKTSRMPTLFICIRTR